MTRWLIGRSPRYIAVALFCIAVNNALLIGLDLLGVYYGVSVLISAAVMIPLAYLLQCWATYSARPNLPTFLRYGAVMLVNTPLAWLAFLLIHDRGGVPMLYAAPLVTLIMFAWNFFASAWAILAQRRA